MRRRDRKWGTQEGIKTINKKAALLSVETAFVRQALSVTGVDVGGDEKN